MGNGQFIWQVEKIVLLQELISIFKMDMTIQELGEKYKNELSYNVGIHELRYNLLSPLFQNLYESKVIYHERFTCIIQLSDIIISPEEFQAKVQRLSLINPGPNRNNPIPESWFISVVWAYLSLSGNHLTAYSSWAIWPDPLFVERVEKLVLEKKYKEAISLLWV